MNYNVKLKTLKAWCIIDNQFDFSIPNIPRKYKGYSLYPSCVFMLKRDAELAKDLAEDLPHHPEGLKTKIVRCKITYEV